MPCERKVKFTHEYFYFKSIILLLDNEFSHFLFLTDYMTVAETVDIVAKEFIAIHNILDHMECKQTHYFFIILG